MTTLLVDNYDSYTYNVFHLLAAVSGEEPIVVRNDVVSWRALSRWDFDAIVLSPGPGRPERWHDFGVCSDILRRSEIPVLGVCLGHQGIGHMLNATVTSAPVVMHGRLSTVRHEDSGLFAGIPQDFKVVRYHSLVVASQMGPEGRVTAWTQDGVVMGVEHTRRPIWGVQFHPESIATEHGHKLFENFYSLARSHAAGRDRGERREPPRRPRRPRARRETIRPLLRQRSVEGEPSTEKLFEALFGSAEYAFWLDSAAAPSGLARRSFLGTSDGEDRCVIEYDVQQKQVIEHNADGDSSTLGSIFEVLDRNLQAAEIDPQPDLPEGLVGGYVGYLGYECKADCGSPNVHHSDVPDAIMMRANRVIAVDHHAHRTHLFALSGTDTVEADRWLDSAQALVTQLIENPSDNAPAAEQQAPLSGADEGPAEVLFRCGRGRERYLADIARCQDALLAGESYEVCLTDQIHATARPDPFTLYRTLRRRNPAPFAAYLKLGEIVIASSSPERFIGIDRDRVVQARPIKGTLPRSENAEEDERNRLQLLSDEKTFAEHLMIVDLLRNDLGRVCEMDSVRVPELMIVEPYTTVHQLISTITGKLDDEHSSVDCVRACFPGGSMTGAPKLRTMSIIDDIEREARGVYSGAIGYFGVDGSVDLNIVIRTIVMRPNATTIGAGGAIVMQSDPEDEFDELLLKAKAPMSALAEATTGSSKAWSIEKDPNPAQQEEVARR